MTAHQMLQLVNAIFKDSWKRHRLTLALLVLGVFKAKRLSLTCIGRELSVDTVPKHAIKRVDRWLGNRRFDDKRAREQLLRLVVGPRPKVLIAVDWTKLRRWPVLVAGIIHRGRAVPVLWSVADPRKLYKSQNAFEHGFFVWLRAALPDGVEATLLLDRGFKRVDLMPRLKGFSFVIPTGGNVHVYSQQYNGPMEEMLWRRGMRRDIRDAMLRPSRPVHARIVAVWEAGPHEPWYLQTNLEISANRVVALYAKRFRIEESFRDQKDWRYGLQAGHVLVRSAARLERLLLVASVVLFLAILFGTGARHTGLDRGFRANTVKTRATHSDFTLGLYYGLRNRWSCHLLLETFYAEGDEAGPRRGVSRK